MRLLNPSFTATGSILLRFSSYHFNNGRVTYAECYRPVFGVLEVQDRMEVKVLAIEEVKSKRACDSSEFEIGSS